MINVGHAISIAGMPGVLQPHDEGYPAPLAEAFILALGAMVDAPIELHDASSQADAHAEINLIQIIDNGAMRPLTYTEKGMCKMVDRYIRLRLGLIERIGTQPYGAGGGFGQDQQDIIDQLQQQIANANAALVQVTSSATAAASAADTALTSGASGAPAGATQTNTQSSEERVVALRELVNEMYDTT